MSEETETTPKKEKRQPFQTSVEKALAAEEKMKEAQAEVEQLKALILSTMSDLFVVRRYLVGHAIQQRIDQHYRNLRDACGDKGQELDRKLVTG